MGDLIERPESCAFKTSAGGISGLVMGAILGAVQATWGDVPKVLKNQALPALLKTGKVSSAIISLLGTVHHFLVLFDDSRIYGHCAHVKERDT